MKTLVALLEQQQAKLVFVVGKRTHQAVVQALAQTPHIDYACAHLEQHAVLMASGYARATGKAGVCILPGGADTLNAAGAIATAQLDSVPLVVISVQPQTPQETQPEKVFEPITKWIGSVETVETLAKTVGQAFAVAASGRPGAVYVDIPEATLTEAVAAPPRFKPTTVRTLRDTSNLNELVRDILVDAKYPIIIAGGGVVSAQAEAELLQLAESMNAPILTTPVSNGVVPPSHRWYAGLTWQAFTASPEDSTLPHVENLDVVLAVGCSLSASSVGNPQWLSNAAVIQIDIDDTQLGKHHPVRVGIISDAKAALRQLLQVVTTHGSLWGDLALKRQPSQVSNAKRAFIEALQQSIQDNRTIVAVEGELADALVTHLTVNRPRTLLHTCGLRVPGAAIPTGIGAKLSQPDARVIVVTNATGFLTAALELQPDQGELLILVVHEENADICAVAEGLGLSGFLVTEPDQLLPTLRRAQTLETPTVIEVRLAL